ncbi:MAG TPA: ferritin-like domain-containing protein [Terracidiphilus sp.]
MPKVDTVEKLFLNEIKDLYSAEKQITRALPKMAKAASSEELRQAFQTHLEETRGQIQRLERVFELIGAKASAKTCEGMKGLLEEGSEIIEEADEGEVRDAGLIGAAQRVEHYEIAAYGTVRAIAQTIGNQEVADLLQQTLDEEGKTDKLLTKIAMRVNKQAQSQSQRNAA